MVSFDIQALPIDLPSLKIDMPIVQAGSSISFFLELVRSQKSPMHFRLLTIHFNISGHIEMKLGYQSQI